MQEGKLRKLLGKLDVDVIHKNSRGWLVAPCPFAEWLHEYGTDRNPSFMVHVNPDGYSGFNCFTCHQHGNLTDLITKLGRYRAEGDDDEEQWYRQLALRTMMAEVPEEFVPWDEARSNHTLDEMDPLDAELHLRMYPLAWEEKDSRKYLKGRGVTQAAAELLDIRYDMDSRRVLFPVYDWERKLFGFTGRTMLPGPYTRKHPKVRDYAGLRKERCILGEHLMQDGLPTLVVEGLFALAHMVSLGVRDFCNPVATMGSHMSEAQRDILVDAGQTVFMLYDNDAAGDLGLFGKEDDAKSTGAVDLLKPHLPTYLCLYPEGIDDPDRLTLQQVEGMVLDPEGSEPA